MTAISLVLIYLGYLSRVDGGYVSPYLCPYLSLASLDYVVAFLSGKQVTLHVSPTCYSCDKANEIEIPAPNLCFGSNSVCLVKLLKFLLDHFYIVP
jgi:hypothetical protein